jgi:putative transposase
MKTVEQEQDTCPERVLPSRVQDAATYAYFADRDPLTRVVLEQMLAGVSTRRFTRTREPVGEQVIASERSASKSAVSREFVGRTRERLDSLMSRGLQDVRLAALMVDGMTATSPRRPGRSH